MSLVVERVAGLATVQDLGRPGHMHEALAPGGALVPELLVAANRSVRNPDAVPAIEVLGRLVVRAERAVVTSERALAAGEELVVTSEPRRVAYLAIRGGVDAPLVLGGRGTQLSAGIGAALRAGDRIAPAGAPHRAGDRIATAGAPAHGDRIASAGEPAVDAFDTAIAAFGDGAIRVIPGPDLDAFEPGALARLVAGPYRILPTSDRVGTRLDGAPLIGRSDVSRPMVRGAIEVPPDGQPIVLGPEHPTTGGYPVIAVVAHADLGRFFALRLGARVSFAIGDKLAR